MSVPPNELEMKQAFVKAHSPVNKIRRISISAHIALDWLKGHLRPYTTNLPADAEIVSMHVEPLQFYSSETIAQQLIVLVLRSEEFAEVENGTVIPFFDVTCQTTTAEFHTVEGSQDDHYISEQACGNCEAVFAIATEPKFCPNCGARNLHLT